MSTTHDRLASLSPDDKRALLARLLRERAQQPHQVPLSFAQEQMWLLDHLTPDSPLYNVTQAFRLSGPLNVAALERAVGEIVRRHDTLRATFSTVDGRPAQVIAPPGAVAVPIVDVRDAPVDERETRAMALVMEDARRPFDLARGPLLRVSLFRLGAEAHILLVNVHHIACDGWSMGILYRELVSLYGAVTAGRPSPLPDLSIQYADYAAWQRDRLGDDALAERLAYWRGRLGDAPTVLELPADHPRATTGPAHGATHSIPLTADVMEALKRLSQDENATLYMTLLAAFQVLLYRYTGRDNLLVGSPIAGRTRVETEPLIGFFVNTLVLRGDLSGDPSFRALLARTRETALDAYAQQDLPFERLVTELQPPRDAGRNPLVQVLFALQNAPRTELQLAGLTAQPLQIDTGTAKFDLSLFVIETPEGAHAAFEYNSDLFDASTIERMTGHFHTLLEGVVADPDQSISALPLLTGAERRQLLVEWNDTRTDYPRDACIHELFAAQAARTPDAIAVVYADQLLTYRELDERANQLAHYLQRLGVGPDVLVGICVERSLEMIVGLLGILKAGGAYVPLDPDYPTERLTFMLEDARVPVLLTQQRLRDQLPIHEARVLYLDADWPVIAAESAEPPISTATGDSVAYVIYTSGSTGVPKGTLIPHGNVVRLFAATQAWFHFDARDVWTFFHSFAFDFSVWELWGALLFGGRLVVVPYLTSRAPAAFYDLVRQERVTVLNQTPSAFAQFIQAEESMSAPPALSLRVVILGGEALAPSALTPWFERHGDRSPRVVNMYGITETTVHVTYHPLTVADLSAATGSVIGASLPDLQVYLLDERRQPVPIGVPGEMYVGGAGLARGYLNRPELTAERFIPHPFSSDRGARLYKTGDLARYRPDGAIEFLGRIDHQVKIRGYRIELGEIEAALTRCPEVRDAVVVTREDTLGDKRLVAYVVADKTLSTAALRRFLQERLPAYMIPSIVVPLDALQLTANGKVDRAALPAPQWSVAKTVESSEAPLDASLQKMIRIWEEALGVQSIRPTDNFFDMGGHSLLAVRLFQRIAQEYGRTLPLATLFEDATVEHLNHVLQQTDAPTTAPPFAVVALQPRGARPPLFLIPAHNGKPLYYRPLIEHLGLDQPVYGIEVRDDHIQQLPRRTVEEVADDFIAALRAHQSDGPYFLGGYSFGGVFAFEMARRLRAAGQDVPLLALFDTMCPGAIVPARRTIITRLRARASLQAQLAHGRVTYYSAVVRALPPGEKRPFVVTRARALGQRAMRRPRPDQATLLTRVESDTAPLWKMPELGALNHYVPEAYAGPITYFWALRNSLAAQGVGDPRHGWRRVAAGGITIHRLPTDHIGIMGEWPQVQQAAHRLRKGLVKAQRAIARPQSGDV